MADDAKLLARLEVRTREAEKAAQNVAKKFDTAISQIEGRARRAKINITPQIDTSKLSSAFASGLGRLSAGLGAGAGVLLAGREIIQAADAWTEMANRLRGAGVASEDLAAQQQKVVDLAISSRAPLSAVTDLYSKLLGITQTLGVEQGQAAIATQAIGQALSLAGVSAGAASGAITQLGQALGSGVLRGDEFNSVMEALGQQNPIIRSIADEFGVATQALRGLAEEGELTSDRVFKAIIEAAPKIKAAFAESIPTVQQATENLTTAFVNFAGQLSATTGFATGLTGVLGGLTGALNSATAALGGFNAARAAEAAEQKFVTPQQYSQSEYDAMIRSGVALGGDRRELNAQIARLKQVRDEEAKIFAARKQEAAAGSSESAATRRAPYGGPLPPARPQPGLGERTDILGDPPGGGGGGKKGGGGGGAKADELKRGIEQLKERTIALQLDTQALGLNTYEAEKLKATQALLNEAMSSGKTVTEAQRQQVEQIADAYAKAKVAFEEAEQAHEALKQSMEDMRSVADAGLGTLVSGLMEGKDAAEALQDALKNMLSTIAEIAQRNLLDALFKGGGGGLGGIGGLFAGLFGGGGPSLGTGNLYAGGTNNAKAGWAIVGENGPELLKMKAGAQVIPNDALGKMGAGGNTTVNVINNNGSRISTVERATAGGGKTIDVTIDEVVADKLQRGGTASNKALRTFGGRQPLTRR